MADEVTTDDMHNPENELPALESQLRAIQEAAARTGEEVDTDEMTRGEAAETITRLQRQVAEDNAKAEEEALLAEADAMKEQAKEASKPTNKK